MEGTKAGLMLKLRKPIPEQQHETPRLPGHFSAQGDGLRGLVAGADEVGQHMQDGGRHGLAEMAHLGIVAVGGHQILDQVVRADGNEIDERQHGTDADRSRGDFHHDADGNLGLSLARTPQTIADAAHHLAQAVDLFQGRDHGEHQPHTASVLPRVRGGAENRPDLRVEELGMLKRQADAPPAQERIRLRRVDAPGRGPFCRLRYPACGSSRAVPGWRR